MDRISGYSQVSEIIPFDYSQPFLLFPVRHHSPVCSWQLIRAIKEYQPDVILIEGPENANDMIGVLTDERTKLPAAFYYYYKDKKSLSVMKPRTINATTLLSMPHLSITL